MLTKSEIRARKLLRGSAVINQLYGEADQLVRMVLGFIPDPRPRIDENHKVLRFPEENQIEWEIKREGLRIHARCTYIPDLGRSRIIYTTLGNKWTDIVTTYGEYIGDREIVIGQPEDVLRVRWSVPGFIDRMVKEFPELEKRWAVILEAAEESFILKE